MIGRTLSRRGIRAPSVGLVGNVVLPGLISTTSNTNILRVSDSLGVLGTHGDLFGKFDAAQIASMPTLTFVRQAWNISTNAYDSPVTLQTGTGPYTVSIWHFAVGGSQPLRMFGQDRAVALDALPAMNVILWNHGKNVSAEQSPDGRMQSAYEMMRVAQPAATHVVILQPPNRDDTNMTAMNAATARVCGEYGDVRVIDCQSSWIAAGKPANWYDGDNLHPGPVGVDNAYLPDLQAGWNAAMRATTVTPARLKTKSTNLLVNGDFANWTGAYPASWTGAGIPATATKDTSFKNADRPYSARLSATAAGAQMRQTFNDAAFVAAGGVARFAGQYLWFAALTYVPFTTNNATSGLIQLVVADEIGTQSLSVQHTIDLRPGAEPTGRWCWLIGKTQRAVGNTPAAATSNLKLYCDSGASTTPQNVYVDRVILGTGVIPNDMNFATA